MSYYTLVLYFLGSYLCFPLEGKLCEDKDLLGLVYPLKQCLTQSERPIKFQQIFEWVNEWNNGTMKLQWVVTHKCLVQSRKSTLPGVSLINKQLEQFLLLDWLSASLSSTLNCPQPLFHFTFKLEDSQGCNQLKGQGKYNIAIYCCYSVFFGVDLLLLADWLIWLAREQGGQSRLNVVISQ